jgi:hypothetical protein
LKPRPDREAATMLHKIAIALVEVGRLAGATMGVVRTRWTGHEEREL